MLFTLAALVACATDDGVAPPAPRPVASIEVATGAVTLLAGDTMRLTAVARDARGVEIEGAGLEWSTTDAATAQVLQDGRIVGLGHGTAHVRVKAPGGASATRPIAVRLTTAKRRFAYTFAHDASAPAPYTPMRAFSHNATGGDIRVTRRTAGHYTVTFGRLAKADSSFRESVLVTPLGAAGERCHLDGWATAPNERDLAIAVSCYDLRDHPVDSKFTVLVVGAHSLPGRHGFAAVDSEGEAAALPPNSYSSSGEAVAVHRSAGRYLVRMRAPRGEFPENFFVSTVGDPAGLCNVASWNHGDWASIACQAPATGHVAARFSLLMLERGRPGKRFAFAWANDPTAPFDQPYSPAAAYQRSSSGQSALVTHLATGEYVVEFPDLGSGEAMAEIVHLSPFGSGLTSCQLEDWADDALRTLRIHVRCWNRATGLREDGQFTVLVLE
ncbi:MAG: Ig-like domain-containing protein [Gemmatimonadaceae bacterium]